MPSIGERLRDPFPTRPSTPVWAGPCSDAPNGGVTQSLLGRFLGCRERFRLHVVEGLQPAPSFNHKLEYGNFWHAAEEAHAKGGSWEYAVLAHAAALDRRFPLARAEINHWANVCLTQFRCYLDCWASTPANATAVPCQTLLQEQVFAVPYTLPSGRTVVLRGKWDKVELRGRGVCATCRESKTGRVMCPLCHGGKGQGIWLWDHKTKGQVIPAVIRRQLTFDLQVMFYVVALESPEGLASFASNGRHPLHGVCYNVVRRPLSGGKGSIVRHKPTRGNPDGESEAAFYARLTDIIRDDPAGFFYRWDVLLTPEDVARFRRQCLDPILEQLCDWWEWMETGGMGSRDVFDTEVNGGLHWRMPFGIWNPLAEGGSHDLDGYLADGLETGLVRTDNLFPELG